VASGKARGIVIGTGQNTEIGRVECFAILLTSHIHALRNFLVPVKIFE